MVVFQTKQLGVGTYWEPIVYFMSFFDYFQSCSFSFCLHKATKNNQFFYGRASQIHECSLVPLCYFTGGHVKGLNAPSCLCLLEKAYLHGEIIGYFYYILFSIKIDAIVVNVKFKYVQN